MKLNMKTETFKKLVKKIKNKEPVEKMYIKKLDKLLTDFKKETGIKDFLFIDLKGNVHITDEKEFNLFVCKTLHIKDIKFLDAPEESRKNLIDKYGKSKANKNSQIKRHLIYIRRKNTPFTEVYYKKFPEVNKDKYLVAFENMETFFVYDFNAFKDSDKIDAFIYLNGNSSTMVREFLKDKKVIFFFDIDFAGLSMYLNMYSGMKCKEKKFFIPENLEEKFKENPNPELYFQSKNKKHLKNNMDKIQSDLSLKKVYELIQEYGAGLEQEYFEEENKKK
jgi:5S rRNA maturation endonuclease (ribonuclease M5)